MNSKQYQEQYNRALENFKRNHSSKAWAQDRAEFWQKAANESAMKKAKKEAQMLADIYKAFAS